MGKYFGTDGFRGEVNVQLTADHAYRTGRFLGWYFNEQKRLSGEEEPAKIVIGKDTRRSGYMLEYGLVAGLTASGADAYILHVTTTPSVAYITRTDRFDCGIMISASHNPYFDNGIKLINSQGEKMEDAVLEKIEKFLDGREEVPFAKRDKIGKSVDYVSGRNRYIGHLISLGIYSFRGIKIGLDCANGSSWYIAKCVFEALGAETHLINTDPDGLNINENAGSTHIEGLQKSVREKKLDIGFAYDGDADRCLCVDENGDVVSGDGILYIMATYLKECGELSNDTVVTTVMSNLGLYRAFDKEGIKYVKTPVGDKYVHEYMVKHNCRLGGEQSGHIIFSKYSTTGDGILTSLKVMEAVIAKKSTLSKLCKPMKLYPQLLVNLYVSDKEKALCDRDVVSAVRYVEEKLGSLGRALLRASGTEPILRLMIESSDEKLNKACADGIISVLKEKGYVI